jgi:hypothetical protein
MLDAVMLERGGVALEGSVSAGLVCLLLAVVKSHIDDSRSPLAHVARLQRTPPRVRMMLARAPQRLLSVCMKPHVVALKDVVSHYTVRVGVCSLDEAIMCV